MEIIKIYKSVFGIENPFQYQREVFNLIYNNDDPVAKSIPIIIKAPTGSGKTESILAPFLSQFIDNKFKIAPRMIYVLPMRVMVNNVAERIRGYCSNIYDFISVDVQHGDVANSPFFISDIIVTTLDQFLYGFARTSRQVGKHIDIPAGSIASSLIVFDEAHMYRDEMTFAIMRSLMEILQKSHIPFIVMTATMPDTLYDSLFENEELFKNKFKIEGEDCVNSSLSVCIEKESLYRNEEVFISDTMLTKISNKKTLIIVNQVKRAQKVYDEIKNRKKISEKDIVLLHSRFTKEDRKKHERHAIELVNKSKDKNKNPSIVVATQVLEAGIDFSAELLLTEMAPADSLIQRAGRCARYDGESGEMIIFPLDEEKGYLPYEEKGILNASNWLNTNKHFNIKKFEDACTFVNETLEYKASDFEARETLIDLYECVLYADEQPRNIQLRDGKPISIIVVDPNIGAGKGKNEKLIDAIMKTNIRESSIQVDIRVGWKLLKEGIIRERVYYNQEKKQYEYREEKDISPFCEYILDINYYDSVKGITPDGGIFI